MIVTTIMIMITTMMVAVMMILIMTMMIAASSGGGGGGGGSSSSLQPAGRKQQAAGSRQQASSNNASNRSACCTQAHLLAHTPNVPRALGPASHANIPTYPDLGPIVETAIWPQCLGLGIQQCLGLGIRSFGFGFARSVHDAYIVMAYIVMASAAGYTTASFVLRQHGGVDTASRVRGRRVWRRAVSGPDILVMACRLS